MLRLNRKRFDDRWGAWAMAGLVGSALGTVVHFALSGRVYYFNSYPVGLVGWVWLIASRGVFLLHTRSVLARASWGLILAATALAATTAPLQAVANLAWWVEGSAVMLAGVLMVVSLPHERSSTLRIAAAVLVAASVVRLFTLRLYDDSLSSTVLRVQ